MYLLATTSKYQEGTKYYTKSGSTYTLFTNYNVGDTITGTIYEAAEYDRMYFRKWGSTGTYTRFPYQVSSISTLPEHDMGANDVDLDAYTNTKGKTIRNRVRHDVASIEFNIPTMTGEELHTLFTSTTNVWLDCVFFYEPSWAFVSKKMYRSGTVTFHRYYVDNSTTASKRPNPNNRTPDPNNNIYTDIQISFIEQ